MNIESTALRKVDTTSKDENVLNRAAASSRTLTRTFSSVSVCSLSWPRMNAFSFDGRID